MAHLMCENNEIERPFFLRVPVGVYEPTEQDVTFTSIPVDNSTGIAPNVRLSNGYIAKARCCRKPSCVTQYRF
jgi:hypothetical protein